MSGFGGFRDRAMPAQANEIRHTAASGGQKGKKPETYRLIPAAFEQEVKDWTDGADSPNRLYLDIRHAVEHFWQCGDRANLVEAAIIAENAMGGRLAARYHVARVYGAGALKYTDDNWRKGYPWSWSYDALHRHLEAIRRGELIDPEMGTPHWANVWWHCAALWTFETEELGTDDRPKKEVR